jgi:hypothetical protein
MPPSNKTNKRKAPSGEAISSEVTPNQVFIGAAWYNVRPKYERAIAKLRTKYPLSFTIVGREATQDAEDLLNIIKNRIESSSYAIFDATAGNPNVSLEFGFAEARDIPRALYLSTHKAAKKPADAPIIADLAGKRRNHYAQEAGLKTLLRSFCNSHPYTKRFEAFMAQKFSKAKKGKKHRARALALKVIHFIDGKAEVRRPDLVLHLQADKAGYTTDEIDDMIRKLHSAGLVRSLQGPYSTVRIT